MDTITAFTVGFDWSGYGMSSSARPSIATHYLRYTVAEILTLIAGFVSYPILTRLLSDAEYGVLGYFDAWMLLLAAIIKLGSQHSGVRFYPHRGDVAAMERYGSTLVLFSFAVSCGIWLTAALGLATLTALGHVSQPVEAWVMLILLLPTVCISYVNAVLTAEERSDLSVRISVGLRWCNVVAIVGIVYFVSRSATGVYVARLISAVIVAGVGVAWVLRHIPMKWRACDLKLWAESVRFGVPMGANELTYLAMSFIDRLMMKQMLNSFVPVGIYTIGYGLALNIHYVFNTGLGMAYNQVSIRQFETSGPEAVVQTKRMVLNVLIYVVVALLVGTLAVGSDLLLFLSGHDKYRSAPVFVWVTVTYVISGILALCGSGLVLHKRSATLFSLTAVMTVVNVVLNLFWIPRYGYMGAVYATAASLIGLNLLQYAFCPRELRALPGLQATLTAAGLGALIWLIAHFTGLFGATSHLARLVLMTVLVVVGFALPAWLLDRSLRQAVLGYWAKRRAGVL